MAQKHPSEEPKNQLIETMKIGDMAYSLEVKLINADKGWFMIEGAAAPSMEYNDPAEKFDFQTVAHFIMRKIALMTPEDLENLKTTFAAGPFRLIKQFREVKEVTLAKNYQGYTPDVLKDQKEKVDNIINMQKSLGELLNLINEKIQEQRNPEEVRKDIKKKIKKTTDS